MHSLLPQAVCTQVSEYCAIYASKKTCSFLFKKYKHDNTEYAVGRNADL